MNELIINENNRLRELNNSELKELLAKGIDLTVKHLIGLSAIWKELESRGEDMTKLRNGLLSYLPMIANGKIEPELVVSFAGQKTLLSALSKLTLREQRQIHQSGHLKLVTIKNNSFAEELVPLEHISAKEVFQAFGNNGLRTIEEQYLLIKSSAERALNDKPKKEKALISGDKLIFDSKSIELDSVIYLLSQHYGVDIAWYISSKTSKTS